MHIRSGKLYENRTWKYLYPCLRSYGSTLKGYLNSVYKLAVGIGDSNVEMESNCIYILFDTNVHGTGVTVEQYRENISNFLEWVRFQSFYIRDYVFEGINSSEKHMLVLRIPKEFHRSYARFMSGKYSEMYTPDQIEEYFQFVSLPDKKIESDKNEKLQVTRAILKKSKAYLPTFVSKVNEDFGTTCEEEDLVTSEFDYPLIQEEEIFNLKKE